MTYMSDISILSLRCRHPSRPPVVPAEPHALVRRAVALFLVPLAVFAATREVFLAAGFDAFLAVEAPFLALETAFLPVPAGVGGNHTALVALAFATSEAPRTAHRCLSVTFLNPLLMSNILLPPDGGEPGADPSRTSGVGLWRTDTPPFPCRGVLLHRRPSLIPGRPHRRGVVPQPITLLNRSRIDFFAVFAGCRTLPGTRTTME